MRREVGLAAILLAGATTYAEAQDTASEKKVPEGLRTMYRLVMTALEKEAQCMRAIGNEKFCRCMGTKLLSIDFVQYVELVAKADEEVDKLSPADKKKIEVARRCRDLCLK
jgi:hypothetical protein